jgi:hypothetical protein
MRPRLEIAALGVSQIIGYGTLYYSFSLLAPSMAQGFGWPMEWLYAALSLALLSGGLVAPFVGRAIDRCGAARLMAVGSVAAALTLVAGALAPSGPVFALALIAMEMASTLVQYGAAFPLLSQRHGAGAQRSIVYLTLIAGFASTLFWPLTAWLEHALDWRQVYLLFALGHLLIALPIHLWLARPSRAIAGEEGAPAGVARPLARGRLPEAWRRQGFVLMALAFALQSFVSSAVLVHMVPMLGGLGIGTLAVLAGTLFGPAQVASRLVNMMLGRDLPQFALAMISAGLLPASLLLLVTTAPSFIGAVAFALLFGMGNGLYSIVGGTLPLELFGAAGFGARQGEVTAIRLIVGAAAPFAFAVMMEVMGTVFAIVITSLIGSGAVLALFAIGRLTRSRPA